MSIQSKIENALAGDRDAIAWLYDTFAPRLMKRLTLRFGEYQGLDAGDILQDTFVYLLDHQGRVLRRFLSQGPSPTQHSFARFIWSAACGIASNRRRSVARHPSAKFDDSADHHPASKQEGGAIARDALARLARCLWSRGERTYLYFQLRYRRGLTPSEVAEVTGWSQKSTYKQKQRLDRALEHCVEQLGLEN